MRFEYGDSRMPVAMTNSGTTYYLTYDQVGSLRAVADSAGNVIKLLTYDSFGNIIDDTNPAFEVPFGFAGGLHDRDTGLMRSGHRDYDPDIGRWTAKDPIFLDGDDTDFYGYCLNDPTNFIDPEGNARQKTGSGSRQDMGSGSGDKNKRKSKKAHQPKVKPKSGKQKAKELKRKRKLKNKSIIPAWDSINKHLEQYSEDTIDFLMDPYGEKPKACK